MLTVEQREKCNQLITPEIVAGAKGATRHIITRWHIVHRLHDDLYSAAYHSLIQSALKWDPKKGDENNCFEGFAMMHVKWDVIDEFREQIGRLRKGTDQGHLLQIRNPLSLDYVSESDEGEEFEFYGLGYVDERFEMIHNREWIWSMCINEREVFICMLYLLGVTMKELGLILGVTEARISQITGRMGSWALATGNV